jgi:hypothetical protein
VNGILSEQAIAGPSQITHTTFVGDKMHSSTLLAVVLPVLAMAQTSFVTSTTSTGSVASTPKPDPPASFLAQMFNNVANCKAQKAIAFPPGVASCINKSVSANGSAIITAGNLEVNDLVGWSEPNCGGVPVVQVE